MEPIFREKIKKCRICGREGIISSILGVCRDCINSRFTEAMPYINIAHSKVREKFSLPFHPPKTKGGIKCNICSHECIMGEGEKGFCGLRWNEKGKLVSLSTVDKAPVYTYLDPHVTNCCASWFCPGGTGLGYPKFAVKPGPELGYFNLAVFFYGCNLNCLFCQNWEHKLIREAPMKTSKEVAGEALSNKRVTCICYFGGDPDVHLPFTIAVNKLVIEGKGNRIIRICYEWNGDGNPILVRKAAEQVFESGGIIKFDLKAPNDELYYALTGVIPKNVWKNFEMIYHEFYNERPIVPILTASTLLVPGYIGVREVEEIAKRISELDPTIPYSLLVFHPDFYMRDLPITLKKTAYAALEVAKKYLENVYLGNESLLYSFSFRL